MRTFVIAGASLAGLNAAEALRDAGFDGKIVAVGAEEHLPYDRPPLSKEVLAGEKPPEDTALRDAERYEALDVEWELGRRATGLDPDDRKVALADGMVLPYDGLVIATGASPRRLPGTPEIEGIHLLRTLDDSLALAAELEGKPKVAVVGAGFIGSEVAATAHGRGCDVVVLEAAPVPLAHALGEEMGAAISALHGDHGVEVRCGVGVEGFEGRGRVEGVKMADGSTVGADVVVVGIGVAPNTGWLDDSGLEIDNGVVCDEKCFAADGVVAAGDVARWPNPLFDEVMRVEHWDNAIQQGRHAAENLFRADNGDVAEPYAPVPWFWSDQYDAKIQFAGRAGPDVEVVDGSVEDRKFAAVYGREGRVTGVLGIGKARVVMKYRMKIADGLAWDDRQSVLEGG